MDFQIKILLIAFFITVILSIIIIPQPHPINNTKEPQGPGAPPWKGIRLAYATVCKSSTVSWAICSGVSLQPDSTHCRTRAKRAPEMKVTRQEEGARSRLRAMQASHTWVQRPRNSGRTWQASSRSRYRPWRRAKMNSWTNHWAFSSISAWAGYASNNWERAWKKVASS